jgi:hypothetical protein
VFEKTGKMIAATQQERQCLRFSARQCHASRAASEVSRALNHLPFRRSPNHRTKSWLRDAPMPFPNRKHGGGAQGYLFSRAGVPDAKYNQNRWVRCEPN